MDSNESFLKKLDTDLATGKIVTDDHRGMLHREKVTPIADDWKPIEPESADDDQLALKRLRQKSWFKKMFIGSCVFAIVSLGIFGYSLYNGKARLTGENVDVVVQAKSFADSGEEVTVNVKVVNHNAVPMELAKLVMKYPLGTAKDPGAFKEINKTIGTVGPGETYTDSFTAQLFGEQGTEKQFLASVEYRLGDANAIFESKGDTKLTLRSSIATLAVTADTDILPGQQIPIQLNLSGNASTVVKNTLVTATYPDGCTLVSADPAPTLDSNLWYVGDIAAGQNKIINMIATCNGNTNSGQTFTFTAGNQDTSNERLISSVYTSTTHSITLSQPFIATAISVANKPYSATSALNQNRATDIQIDYQNTTDKPITNASISVKLSGDGYDVNTTLSPTGFFNTATNTITWTGQEWDALHELQPGEKGQLIFSVTPKTGLTAPATIDLTTSVRGVLTGGLERMLDNVATVKIAVATNFDIIPKTLYWSGLLKNTGPMPMVVGKETTFTIVWQLTNSTNPVTGAVVKTTLPTGVVWKNIIAPSTESKNMIYNTVTRELTWNAGDVPVGTNARSVSFTVSVTPTKPQVDSVLNLTTDVLMTGTDSVTKAVIDQKKRAMNTRLTNDTSKVGVEGTVKAQ